MSKFPKFNIPSEPKYPPYPSVGNKPKTKYITKKGAKRLKNMLDDLYEQVYTNAEHLGGISVYGFLFMAKGCVDKLREIEKKPKTIDMPGVINVD